jgi:signal transduction histidine kinase
MVSGARAAGARVAADPDRLRQVFINLLSNAVRHNDKDAVEIRVESRCVDGRFEAVVSDNGPGVSPEDRERVFSLFSATWTKAGEKGAGLGLAISRGIMDRMGGDLVLEEGRPGEGARFRVTLPLTEEEPPP